jgi:hypothetical protein
MKYVKTITKNRLRNILGMGFITLLILALFLAWGHVQGRSHKVVDLYFSACKALEQGSSSDLTNSTVDLFPLL